ncbi:MAG: isoprenylcysteine carboxylmethyltransferase family protein [Thermodesulfobacteriota bacterium]
MRADPIRDDAGEGGWLPLAHAAAAALAIAVAGRLGSIQVWVLVLAGGIASYWIARRDLSEPATKDHVATLLRLSFLAVLCAGAWDNRDRTPGWPPVVSFGEILGGVLIVAGMWLRHRALAALGPHFSIKLLVRADHRLVDGGPYRLLRHPNYAGLALVMAGTALALRSPLALLAVLLLWLPSLMLRIGQEESALRRHLGEAYERYSERTWRLVPGLY